MQVLMQLTSGGTTFATGKYFDKRTNDEKIELLNSIIHTLTINRSNTILLNNNNVFDIWKNTALKLQFCKDLLTGDVKGNIAIPDENLSIIDDTYENRLKLVQDIFTKERDTFQKIKDEFLLESEDAKLFRIY